jgi:hypothetical protein
MVAVNMTVNGKKHQVFAKPHWPLRDVLRTTAGPDINQGYVHRLRRLRFVQCHYERPADTFLHDTGY